MSFANSDFDKF